MGLTQEELNELRNYKYVTDDDNIRIKNIIKEKLFTDKRIIHVLNNKTLDEDAPDEYIGKNIFDFYLIPGVITDVENYICFETKISEVLKNNQIIKINQIIFYVLCDEKNIIDVETGISRHDLLCALIKDIFNHTNYFGNKVSVVEETPSVTDNDYATRTLIFEMEAPNSIVKTKNGIPRVINNKVVH